MTAAAMEGDRERCLNAGMDDYITKPVRPDVIAEVIERWAHTSHEVAPAPSTPTTISPARVDPPAHEDEGHEVLDVGQVELLRSLDDGQGMVLAEVIAQYLDQSLVLRDNLADAVVERDAGAMEHAAHSLRGSSANVGAANLAQICGELEALARQGELSGAAKLMELFDAELVLVCGTLGELLVRA